MSNPSDRPKWIRLIDRKSLNHITVQSRRGTAGAALWVASCAALLFACTITPTYVSSAGKKDPIAEIEATITDRWAVQNENYGSKWHVESKDIETKWSVKTKPFSDSLGEEENNEGIPIVNRGFKIDDLLIAAPEASKGKKSAKKKPDKKAQKKSAGKKKVDKNGKKTAKKTANKSAKKAPAEMTASATSGGTKKGSYKKHTLKVDGKQREYFVYTPAGYKKGEKLPVVVAFHGFQSDANGMRWLIKPDSLANKYKYMIVYPNAMKKSWAVGKGNGSTNKDTDDLAFSKALYKTLLERHPINKNRFYVMGFSNGAQMTALWACSLGGKVTAAAMVAHTMNIPGCKPTHRTPMAVIHGMQDRLAPYKGGGKFKLSSHAETVEFFKKVNATADPKIKIVEGKTYKCSGWLSADKKSEVVDCVTYNDGHSWPGGVEFMVDVLGTTNKELNANDFLFKFFGKYKTLPSQR